MSINNSIPSCLPLALGTARKSRSLVPKPRPEASGRFTTQPNFSLVFLWPAGRGGKKVELNDCTKQKEKPIQVIRIFPAFLH